MKIKNSSKRSILGLDLEKLGKLCKESLKPFKAANSDSSKSSKDSAWLDSDLSNLGTYESYDWEEGELDHLKPVRYIPGKGLVAE